jgi:hypothetical protein
VTVAVTIVELTFVWVVLTLEFTLTDLADVLGALPVA